MNSKAWLERFIDAAFNGDVAQVLFFLEAGADVNEMGRNWNPLHAAIENEQVETVPILLQAGADPNFSIGDFTPLYHAIDTQIDGYQQTLATKLPSADLVKLLVEAGADVNAEGKGQTPLQMAEERGHKAAAEYLLTLKT